MDTIQGTVSLDLAERIQAQLDAAYARGFADGANHAAAKATASLDVTVDSVITYAEEPVFHGQAVVVSPTQANPHRVFTRSSEAIRPDYPTAIRFEANRALTKSEIIELSHIIAYLYRATVRGEGVGRPQRDTERSFICDFDTIFSNRTDPMTSLDEFQMKFDEALLHGTPVRKTDKAGPGTKGTRAVYGLGDPDLRIALYFDRVAHVRRAA